MSADLMGYDVLARDALRGVVKAAMRRAADEGLPGAHHFYITFKTRAEGVDLDPDLLARHPDDMTIVLEHQYWDLGVTDEAFEVTLKFNRVPKYIKVPFAAVVDFADPSVKFRLTFDPPPLPPRADARAVPAASEGESGQVVSLDAFRKKPT